MIKLKVLAYKGCYNGIPEDVKALNIFSGFHLMFYNNTFNTEFLLPFS